jgi:hypothetical protein
MADEPRNVLENWIKSKSAKYPVVRAPRAFTNYKIRAVPSKYLVDVRGKIVDEGHPSSSTIEPYLASAAVPPPLEYSKKFDSVKRFILAGKWGDAWDQCSKLEKDKTDGETAKKLKEWIDEFAKKEIAYAEKNEASDVMASLGIYLAVEKRWKGEAQKAGKAKIEAIKKDKDLKKALDAKKYWDQAGANALALGTLIEEAQLPIRKRVKEWESLDLAKTSVAS